jgi:hypothetical protein
MVDVPEAPFVRDYQRDYSGEGTKEEELRARRLRSGPFLFGFLIGARG